MTGIARRGSFHRGYWFRPRGSSQYSVPKVESPDGGFWLPAELEPWRITCEAAGSPYLPARSLLGVWRGWNVGSPDSSTETSDPVFRVSDAWKHGCFRASAHPPMMTETKLMRSHHLDRQQTTSSGLPAIRPVQGPAFGLELEELLEAKLLCFFTIVFQISEKP